ncbi:MULTISPECIES: PqiC family protein [Geobacter]|uniref:PqiC family protein n=1 Tax=Geobacter TaxID=28231 RepID=UPI0025731068|nr:PqiC family protein [Geobacter sulfurreducens]BEH10286.1 PqiC family protein [Geobacter sulfurreducens subsp. ethanolicus]BET58129.1 PqiC family protein [Geobacter sp. 60473]
MRLVNLPVMGLLLLVLLQLAACGSTPPARFYALSSLAGDGNSSSGSGARRVIGIGPLAMAEYLSYPGIVIRSGRNTLVRSEFNRWGAPLSDELSRVLVENIQSILSDEKYLVLPWLETATIDQRVQLNVTRFEATSDGVVVLNATWLLIGKERNTLLASGDTTITEPVRGAGYEAIAEAMSRTLAELSRRIALEICRTASTDVH